MGGAGPKSWIVNVSKVAAAHSSWAKSPHPALLGLTSWAQVYGGGVLLPVPGKHLGPHCPQGRGDGFPLLRGQAHDRLDT